MEESIPRLSLSALLPSQRTERAKALEYLRRVERIQITKVTISNDAVYHAVEVYLVATNSRIPMLNRIKIERALSQEIDSTDKRASDGSVLRRFTEFEEFLKKLMKTVDRTNLGACRALRKWLNYLAFNWTRPGAIVKLCSSKRLRTELLTRFLNGVLQLNLETALKPCESCQDRYFCQVTCKVPTLLHEFLTN